MLRLEIFIDYYWTEGFIEEALSFCPIEMHIIKVSGKQIWVPGLILINSSLLVKD